MNDCLVTIGITAYNAEQTIVRALSSAINQSWSKTEVVVVDDCSTDKTLSVLHEFAQKHSGIRVFQNLENKGVAVSRNKILEFARGEFVVFFDDDDESMLNRVEMQLQRIEDYETQFAEGMPVICHTGRLQAYPDGSKYKASTMGVKLKQLVPHGSSVVDRVLLGSALNDGYGACPTCSQAARLSTYKLVGGFDPEFRRAEDTDLVIRLAKIGAHFVGIDDPLVSQTMTKTSDKSLEDEYFYATKLMYKHKDVFDRVGQFEFCRRWLDIKQAWLKGYRWIFLIKLCKLMLLHPILVLKRLLVSFQNIRLNNAFSRFHKSKGD